MNVKRYKKGTRTKLTKNFSSTEMDCKCNYPECKWTLIDVDHILWLQNKRDKWNKIVHILSGYRCEKHNLVVGGASKSRHLKGDATDIKVENKTPDQVADDCEDAQGLGRYKTFTHVDSRPNLKNRKSRWDFRK